MPVHKAATFVRESRILAQSFRNFELLVVGDASTDETGSILESFDDPRNRVIRSRERLCFSGALNAGLAAARGMLPGRNSCPVLDRWAEPWNGT